MKREGYVTSNMAVRLRYLVDRVTCMTTNSLQFEHYDYVISDKPDDSTMTFRDALTWVG